MANISGMGAIALDRTMHKKNSIWNQKEKQ